MQLEDLTEEELNRRKARFHEAYGRMAMGFEKISIYMKTCIQEVLSINGLEDHRLSLAVLSPVSAIQLKSCLRAIFSDSGAKLGNPDSVFLKRLFNKTTKAIELRNELIHNHWEIAFAGKGEALDYAEGFRNKLTADGVSFFNRYYGVEDFETAANEFEALASVFEKLYINMNDRRDLLHDIDSTSLDHLKLCLSGEDMSST